MVKLTENYDSPYNKWKVTTEGDEEGKTIINLGTYEGYLDDIAFFLGDKAFDSLTFKPLSLNIPNNPRSNYVRVKLEVDSKTWDLSPNEVKDYMIVEGTEKYMPRFATAGIVFTLTKDETEMELPVSFVLTFSAEGKIALEKWTVDQSLIEEEEE